MPVHRRLSKLPGSLICPKHAVTGFTPIRVVRIMKTKRYEPGDMLQWPPPIDAAPRSHNFEDLERAKGFEPSTPTLARSCSTTELHPHPRVWRRSRAGNGQSYAKCRPRMQQPVRAAFESAGSREFMDNVRKTARKRAEPVPRIANWAFNRQLGLGPC